MRFMRSWYLINFINLINVGTFSVEYPASFCYNCTIGKFSINAGSSNESHCILCPNSILNYLIFTYLASAFKSFNASSLSSGRRETGSVVAGNKLYYGGGLDTGYSSTIDVYDSTTGIWSTLPVGLSVARYAIACTFVGTKIIFACGYYPPGISNVVDIYDINTLTFSTTTFSVGRTYIACGSITNRFAIFAFGYTNPISNAVDIYNSTSRSWSSSTLSTARYAAFGISYGSKFYAGGGCIGGESGLSIVDIFNADTLTWTNSSISIGRCYGASTNVGSILFFAGGYSGGSVFNRVDIYDANLNIWSTTSMVTARRLFAATSLGCKAIFAGGHNGGYIASVEVYDASSNTWATISNLQVASYGIIGLSVGSVAIFAGGEIVNSVNYYSYFCSSTGIIYSV